MKPVVFTIPGIDWGIPGYGLMLMIGFLAGIWWAVRRAVKSGGNPDAILNCGFVLLIGGIVGCRLMYVVHYWDQFAARGSAVEIIWAILNVTKGGLEFYGGFILAFVLVIVWLRFRERASLRWYLDIIAPSAALGLAIGRIGCFLNGCCYGGVCELPWAVRFPASSPPAMTQWQKAQANAGLPEQLLFEEPGGLIVPIPRDSLWVTDEQMAELEARQRAAAEKLAAAKERLEAAGDPQQEQALGREVARLERQVRAIGNEHFPLRANMRKYGMTVGEMRALAAEHRSLPVHPVQLYSTITALIVAFFLNALYWRRTRDGQVIFTLLLIEPVTRWVLEVIRADNPVDTLGVFTISQGLAIAMMIVGALGLLWLRTQPPRSPRAALWVPPEAEARDKRKGKAGRARPASDAG